jgi:hypothetical protein
MSRRVSARTKPKPDALAALRSELMEEICEVRALLLHRLPAPDGDLISTTAAGRLIGKSPETLRRWCIKEGIGTFSPAGACYLVSRKRLAAYLLRTTGVVPEALRAA